jgi:hypothetical protein
VVAFVALLMTAVVFVAVGYPLLRPGRGRGDLAPTDRRDELLARRDEAYAAIEELESEFHLGNLSQREYEELGARYRQRAEDVLRELKAIQ